MWLRLRAFASVQDAYSSSFCQFSQEVAGMGLSIPLTLRHLLPFPYSFFPWVTLLGFWVEERIKLSEEEVFFLQHFWHVYSSPRSGLPICEVDFNRREEGHVSFRGKSIKITFYLGSYFLSSGYRRLAFFEYLHN